jgi:hypothetical protein
MPRVATSNGIKPYLRALAVIKMGVPVTPTEINDHVGTGDYAAKYISFLRTRNGFEFTIQKDGRKVVSYTMIKEPADVEALRNLQPKAKTTKAPKAKVAKAPKVKASKALAAENAAIVRAVTESENVAEIKAKNLETMKKVAAKFKPTKVTKTKKAKRIPRESDYVRDTFGTTGEIATSYNVDRDWDSIEGLDLQKLL